MSAPLYGLVLAGGSSSRMQRDKAALQYQGESQLSRAARLLQRHVTRVFVSVRPAQADDPLRKAWPLIIDSVEGEGPIVGIRSAFAAHAEVAWLVIACDLPFLSDATLDHLVAMRREGAVATAYRSTYDSLPEPLCAIWEPRAAPLLAAHQEAGFRCPRKFLIRNGAPLIDAVDAHALDNINTPQEYEQARASF